MMKFNWFPFLKKITASLFILILLMTLVNKIGFGMNLINLRLFSIITVFLILILVFIKLKNLSFDPKLIRDFIENKLFIVSAIIPRHRTNLVFRRFFDWLVIPLFLIILGLGLFLNNVLHQKEPFSVLVQTQNKSAFLYGKSGEILAGEKVWGEFKAIEDNLGMMTIRFTNLNRINSDVLVFRIKEKWGEDWYYENEYKVDQFQNYQLFPFGFPLIPDSKDKIYQFEIQSTKGVVGDAVALSGPLPIFEAKYQFSKDKILSNQHEKLLFVHKKLLNLMSNRDFSVTTIIFFFPLPFYLLWSFLTKKYFAKAYILAYFVILGILLDGILVHQINNQATLLLICLWALTLIFHKMNYKFSVFASFFCLFVCFLLLLFDNNIAAAKIANWIYFSLVIAMIQLFFVYLGEKIKYAKTE